MKGTRKLAQIQTAETESMYTGETGCNEDIGMRQQSLIKTERDMRSSQTQESRRQNETVQASMKGRNNYHNING